jgi:hypothetical protein
MAGLLLIFGVGTVQTASADAEPQVSGSSVWFQSIDSSIPKTMDLRNTSTTGYKYLQAFGTTRNNVAKTCPRDSGFEIYWSKDGGVNHVLEPGQCFWPSQPDLYWVGLQRS